MVYLRTTLKIMPTCVCVSFIIALSKVRWSAIISYSMAGLHRLERPLLTQGLGHVFLQLTISLGLSNVFEFAKTGINNVIEFTIH